MVDYRTKVYLLTFLAYLGVHALRTSYSFSKQTLIDVLTVNDTQLGTPLSTQDSSTPS